MNIFLCTTETNFCEKSVTLNLSIQKTNIRGIAVKLSRLRDLGVSLDTVIEHANGLSVLVDAEYDRLDFALNEWLESLTKNVSSRILLTVQMKREDAFDQLQNLESQGISTVLTRGNSAYLKGIPSVRNAYKSFREAISRFENIAMVAGTLELATKIGIAERIQDNPEFLLELQGTQSLKGTSLWMYFNNGFFSREAIEYVNRRRNVSNQDAYICTSDSSLNRLLDRHHGYVFVDACCKARYLELLMELTS